MTDRVESKKLQALVDDMLNGRATAAEMDRLDRLIREDTDACRTFVEHVLLDVDLEYNADLLVTEVQRRSNSCDDLNAPPEPFQEPFQSTGSDLVHLPKNAARAVPPPRRKAPSSKRIPRNWITVAAVLFIAVGAILGKLYLSGAQHVATLHSQRDVRWLQGKPTSAHDSQLLPGQRLVIAEGVIEIRYLSGARMALKGPAEFVIGSQGNSGFLKYGKLVAHCETTASQGFAIETPHAHVVDLGTEFGVDVRQEDGAAEFVVLSGEVEVACLTQGKEPAQRVKVTTGQGAVVSPDEATIGMLASADLLQFAQLHEQLQRSFFTPDPSKKYYINCPATGERLAADGTQAIGRNGNYSETVAIPQAVKQTETGANVEWKFIAIDDKWHIQKAAGGDNPRLRAVNLPNIGSVAMTDDSAHGGWTQFTITSVGGGKYHITAPQGPAHFQRLSFTGGGKIAMAGSSQQGPQFEIEITEVGSAGN